MEHAGGERAVDARAAEHIDEMGRFAGTARSDQRHAAGRAHERRRLPLQLGDPPQEGPPLAVRIEARRSPGGQDCRAVLLDITARRRAEDEARAATAEAQRLLLASDQTRRVLLSAAEDERESAAELRTLYAELEQRVKDRTAALDAANKELEAFSYSVSHDLRAPLRAIDGFSRIVQEDYAAKLDDEGRDSLARIRAAAQRMAQLIDDLLKLSPMTRADLNRQPVDLSALARDVTAELRQRDPDRAVDLVVADGLTAYGDPRLLRVVLENLLGNAWKFTERRERARIEFGVVTRDGRPTWFIRDNGAGFDPTLADKLFGPFQRLHSVEEFAGTGIGLATVQRIVRRHGGQVWAQGTVDQGATLWFDLGSETESKRTDL